MEVPSLHTALHRLNLLMYREVLRLRAAHLLAAGDFRGLYISDAHVDALLRRHPQTGSDLAQGENPSVALDTLTAEADRLWRENRVENFENPLPRLASTFQLDDFEQDVLLLAIAPELDLQYETLCSYVNDDVTRKRPNADLAVRLFTSDREERWERRKYFTPEAPLFAHGLLEWFPEAADTPASSLARPFLAAARIILT